MKKPFTIFIIVLLFCPLLMAVPKPPDQTAKLKQQINNLNVQIKQLQKNRAPAAKIHNLEAKQEQLVKQLATLEKARLQKVRSRSAKLTSFASEEATGAGEGVEETSNRSTVIHKPLLKGEIGGLMGMFGGMTGLLGEVRFPLRGVVGPATPSVRLAGGYLQNADDSRRFVTMQGDFILSFPAGSLSGVQSYLGAGGNYIVLTSGRVPGTFGGEVFYGVESSGLGGKIFGELGYGVLQTGFTPLCQGTTVLLGYRTNWQLF